MPADKYTIQLSLDERKKIMLGIMEKLTVFLESHNLKYCLIGGTLIGAVRHKGFIPWDDDMDIGMPMDDYKKFIEITKNTSISSEISVSSVYTNPDHIWPMTKVIDITTCLIEPNVLDKYIRRQEKFGGIYVDVFPIYGLPDDEAERKKFCKKIVRQYTRVKNSSRMVVFKKGYGSPLRRLAYNISFIPLKIIGLDYFLKELTKTIETYPFKENGYNGYALGIVKNGRDSNPGRLYLDLIDVPFENLTLKIPRDYDLMLKNQFGDYMKLPPEDQRRTHPGIASRRKG